MQYDIKDITRKGWLDLRMIGIGGSDAGAIVGLNPHKSQIDVWLDKTGKSKDLPDNEAMRVGRDLEQYVAKRFCEATGKKVRRRNVMFRDDQYPYMIANVDRVVVGENALLECKTANAYSADKWEDGKIPESYEIQCHHYMAVTGTKKVYIACLIMGIDFVVREVERDEDVIEALRKIEGDFWNDYVMEGQMPPPDGSKSAGDALKSMYPFAKPDSGVHLYNLDSRLDRIDEIKALIGDLERESEEIKQSIQIEMKDAEIAYESARKVTWKMQKGRTSIDSKRLKAEAPDIYEEYTKTGEPSRVFRIGKKVANE